LNNGSELKVKLGKRFDGGIDIIFWDKDGNGWDLLALLPNGTYYRHTYIEEGHGFDVNEKGQLKQLKQHKEW
jgi:hypothetical protein